MGAGLPHLPAVLSARSRTRTSLPLPDGRPAGRAADLALVAPAADEAWSGCGAARYEVTGGYPYFVQAYGKAVWDTAPRTPITREDVVVGAPHAEAELAVGFFGSRYDRATPGERDYLRAMADADADGLGSVATSEVARVLGRTPQSLSPARDSLLKKGLVSPANGAASFHRPHFGRYLARSADPIHAADVAYCLLDGACREGATAPQPRFAAFVSSFGRIRLTPL